MTDGSGPWIERVVSYLRTLLDLLLVGAGVAVMSGVVLLPWVAPRVLRRFLGLVFVSFLPGYAIVSVLFPRSEERPERAEASSQDTGSSPGLGVRLSGPERLVLSFGTSLAIVPIVGLTLWLLTRQVDRIPFFVGVGAVTILATIGAAIRRVRLPPTDRYTPPVDRLGAAVRSGTYGADTKIDIALNVVIAVSLLAAVVSVPYAIWVPDEQSSFTQVALLTEAENGSLVAGEYPSEFVRGEPQPVVLNVTNREQHRMNYTMVVELQRVGSEGKVLEDETLRREPVPVPSNTTRSIQLAIRPTMVGDDLRLAVLLYTDSVPPNPSLQNSYRSVHVWISVTDDQ